MRHLLLFILFSLVLVGCAGLLADKECNEGKWYEVGYRDGADGRNAVEYWRSNCSTWNINVDAASYERGRLDGVARSYCVPDKAFSEGRAGRLYDLQQCGGRQELRVRHDAGLREYCTPQNAYAVGGKGERYEFDRCGKAAAESKRAWQDGVTNVYCRPADAYHAGREDEKFHLSLCPPQTESAYRTGMEVRFTKKSLSEVDSELYDQRRKRDEKNAKDDDKRYADNRIRDLEREKRRLKEKLDTLERVGRNY